MTSWAEHMKHARKNAKGQAMSAKHASDEDRCQMVVRQWRILMLLRRRQRSIHEMAVLFGVCDRTVRRDLYALSRVFPITRASADDSGPWMLNNIPSWPMREIVPIADLGARD